MLVGSGRTWSARGAHPLSAAVAGILSLALLVPVAVSCLCPAETGSPTQKCCPAPKGVGTGLASDDCCVAPEARPVSGAAPTGTPPLPILGLAMSPAVYEAAAPVLVRICPGSAPLPGAGRPLLNLRI